MRCSGTLMMSAMQVSKDPCKLRLLQADRTSKNMLKVTEIPVQVQMQYAKDRCDRIACQTAIRRSFSGPGYSRIGQRLLQLCTTLASSGRLMPWHVYVVMDGQLRQLRTHLRLLRMLKLIALFCLARLSVLPHAIRTM